MRCGGNIVVDEEGRFTFDIVFNLLRGYQSSHLSPVEIASLQSDLDCLPCPIAL